MNLALEQYVFDTLALEDEFFMLWRNRDAVIVGLHQNTAEEVNLAYAEQSGIKIVRRLSGGGAVFHDFGNLNFTFITNAESPEALSGERFYRQISNALSNIGVQSELNGRNDITIDGGKFSGTASYLRDGRLMYHGTLLFDTDFDRMATVLRVSDDKIASKGVSSVRDRVTNIRRHLPHDMTMDEFWAHLRVSITGDMEVYTLTERDIGAIDVIRRERYATWEWNFGRSPGYSIVKRRRIPGFGAIKISMDIRDEKIAVFTTNGDFFGDRPCDDVSAALIGVRLTSDELHAALSHLSLDEYYRGLSADELVRLILE